MAQASPPEESLRALIARVIDSATAFAKAEAALVRKTATTFVSRGTPAAGMVVVAILLVQAALTVLVAALGMLLAIWIGPAGGLAVAALIALLLAGLLAWLGYRRVTRIFKSGR